MAVKHEVGGASVALIEMQCRSGIIGRTEHNVRWIAVGSTKDDLRQITSRQTAATSGNSDRTGSISTANCNRSTSSGSRLNLRCWLTTRGDNVAADFQINNLGGSDGQGTTDCCRTDDSQSIGGCCTLYVQITTNSSITVQVKV